MLLLATLQAAPATAPRIPVPARADAAKLDTAAQECAAANGGTDRCFDLFMALGRAQFAARRYREAKAAVETGRLGALAAYTIIANSYDDAIGQAAVRKVGPEQVDPAFPRLASERRRLWSDMADAHLLRAQIAEAEGDLFDAASGFSAYWSIHSDYVKDPARAELALATGLRGIQAYLTAGAADRADSILRFSLPAAERTFGADHPTIIGMQLARAQAQSAMGNYADAEPMFADVRARAARAGRPLVIADADAAYARHLIAVDRPREALELLRGAVNTLAAAKASPARMAQAYRDFAEVSPGEDALPLIARAVDLHVAAYGPDHLLTGRARIVAAGLLDREGLADAAERERAAGIDILSKHLSILTPEIALAKLRQAENMLMKNRCNDVQRLAGYALDSFGQIAGGGAQIGSRHPNTARALFLIGMCELRSTPASGIDRLNRAAAIQHAVLAPTHPERMQTDMTLGLIARAQGNHAAALARLRAVADAARERVASYTSFDATAQREQRAFSPVYAAIVQTAWTAAQTR